MLRLFLVMMGCMEIGIERCWKQVCGGQWSSWKSLFEQPQESLFKENSWIVNLRCFGLLVRNPEKTLFLECDKRWIQATCFSRNDIFLMNSRDLRVVPLPVFQATLYQLLGR